MQVRNRRVQLEPDVTPFDHDRFSRIAAMSPTLPRPSLLGPELGPLIETWGEPAFRARQIARWVYREFVFDPHAMADVPKQLRDRLVEAVETFPVHLVDERSADQGQTSKALLRLGDGRRVVGAHLPTRRPQRQATGVTAIDR